MVALLVRTSCLGALGAAFLVASPLAHAEMGPCKPDKHDSFICGDGNGAARVITDTVSPSKQFALAWRTPDGPPTQEPDDDKIELVLVRLKDGAALTKTSTSYWATGEMRVNRLQEQASWSPNSRYVVRAFQSRFETGDLDLFAIGTDGAFAGTVNLLKPMQSAVRAALRLKVKNPNSYVFSVSGGDALTIDNGGLLHAPVMMWVPKDGPERNYKVTVQITQKANAMRARVVSVAPTGPR